MKGDYFRYKAEYKEGEDKIKFSNNSLKEYQNANDIVNKELSPTNPIRLGLSLSYSVFYYEILNLPNVACEMAKKAFDEAICEIDTLTEDSYKDSTLILQLLRDNLTIWSKENDEKQTIT